MSRFMNINANTAVRWATRPAYVGLEFPRMMLEATATPLSLPLLARHKTDNGRPVLVAPPMFPALSTKEMRLALQALGHDVHSTPQLTNVSKKPREVRQIVIDETVRLAEYYGEPITLVGWCYGGAFTRMAAQARPDCVRQVVNLGSALEAWWYPEECKSAGTEALPVPSTVIYSHSDMAFDHHRVRESQGRAQTENIRIPSSHFGMANHPMAIYVVADRLGQPLGEWRPFAGWTTLFPTSAPAAA